MRVYKEVTCDHGYSKVCRASDNNADYIITSAQGHDLYNDYIDRYGRQPSSRWYNKHFYFDRKK